MAYNHKQNGHGVYFVIIIFICLFIVSYCNPKANSTPQQPTTEIIDSTEVKNSSTYLYDSTLTQLKFYEGFKSKWYKCSGGQLAIGYGFSKKIWNKDTINIQQADSILRLHFNKCLKIAEADGLTGNKSLAIADFIYNLGEWGYKKSTLRKLILEGKPIDKKIIQYRMGGGKILKGLEKRRAWELKIYNTP